MDMENNLSLSAMDMENQAMDVQNKETDDAFATDRDGELSLKRSELEAALEASRRSTSSKLFPEGTGALSSNKEKFENFPGKEDMEKSLQRLEKDLEEARREQDKARQELKRLKETEESEKMDEDSRLTEELCQTNEIQRFHILGLEKTLKQAMANQEEIKSSNDHEIRKLKGIIEDLNQKLSNCLRTIDSKNVELVNLQTALGQYYAEIEAKEHFERELAVAKELSMASDGSGVNEEGEAPVGVAIAPLGQYYAETEAKEHFERELAVAKVEAMKLSAEMASDDGMKTLKQAMANQEEIKSSNDHEIRKSKGDLSLVNEEGESSGEAPVGVAIAQPAQPVKGVDEVTAQPAFDYKRLQEVCAKKGKNKGKKVEQTIEPERAQRHLIIEEDRRRAISNENRAGRLRAGRLVGTGAKGAKR